MRATDSNRVLFGSFLVLALCSVGLKAFAHPAGDAYYGPGGRIEAQLVSTLRSQGFRTAVRRMPHQGSIIYATRGPCRLSVRDARHSDSYATVFSRSAASIGPLRYLYRDDVYAAPPVAAARLGHLETELLVLAGLSTPAHIPVALAASPSCGAGDFRLGDVRAW